MNAKERPYRAPPVTQVAGGAQRRVGFELEFSGIDLEAASGAVVSALGGEISADTQAEHVVVAAELGEFSIEIDWDFLKRKARESADGETKEWVDSLSKAAPLLVPIEVVAPPIAIDRLSSLDPLVAALRAAGAQGTEESLIAAYGVHINPETPSLDAPVVHRYLCAFALLQWWLFEAHEVDIMRRLTPYINPWPEAYLQEVLTLEDPDTNTLIDSYLAHNPTRNRALDMLPLFSQLDPERVKSSVDDGRIKARPTFHYRLPNCHIEHPDWSLAKSWNIWCVVEALAWDPQWLAQLSREFLDSQRPLLGVSHADWVQRIDRWRNDCGLV